jgi:hypothetical protein
MREVVPPVPGLLHGVVLRGHFTFTYVVTLVITLKIGLSYFMWSEICSLCTSFNIQYIKECFKSILPILMLLILHIMHQNLLQTVLEKINKV